MKKTITLDCFGIVVDLDGEGSGEIRSELHEGDVEFGTDNVIYDSMMDAIESMVLAHACAGIDIEALSYIEGIEAAVIACANNS